MQGHVTMINCIKERPEVYGKEKKIGFLKDK